MYPHLRPDTFWQAYREALAARVASDPEEYAMRPGECATDYARITAGKMRAAVEKGGGADFSRVNYRDSAPMRAAARACGVAFTRDGLNSLYRSR